MTDIIQDVRDYFADRFSSPLWISIGVSWLLINWQIPITALFQTENFNVAYIQEYSLNASHWHLITLPFLFGIIYSIFSSSAKETLEVLSKSIRSLIASIDRNGIFYKSISIVEHEKQLSRLKRKIQRIETEKDQLNQAIAENAALTEEKNILTNSNSNLVLEIENLKSNQTKIENTNKELEKKCSKLELSRNVLEEKNKNNLLEIRTLIEKSNTNEEIKNKINELTKENKNLSSMVQSITEKLEKAATIIELHRNYYTSENHDMEILLIDLEEAGILSSKTRNKEQSQEIKWTNNYYETIIRNCNSKTKKNLENPNSSESILLTLELIKSVYPYGKDRAFLLSGAPHENMTTTLKLISSAGWVDKNQYFEISLSKSGNDKLNELQNDLKLSNLSKIIKNLEDISEKNILSEIQKGHFSEEELKEKINFTPSITVLLKRLEESGKIKKAGTVYFPKNT